MDNVEAVQAVALPFGGRPLRTVTYLAPQARALHMPAGERAAARAALTELHRDAGAAQVLREQGVERFVAVGDRDYDDIRRMERQARDAGLLPEPVAAMGLAGAAAPAA